MKLKGSILGATLAFAVVTGAGVWSTQIQAQSVSFTVYPYWMKRLPNFWVTGVVSGVCVGAQDHVFILTQGFQTGGLASPEGCRGHRISAAYRIDQSTRRRLRPVIEFDSNGDVFNTWGNPALVAQTDRAAIRGTERDSPERIAWLLRRLPRQCLGCRHRRRRRSEVLANGSTCC